MDRTGLHVQQGTNVSRDDWSGRTAGYTCLQRGMVWKYS